MHISSTHHLKGTYLIGASSVALTLLAGALLFPSLPDGASAADPSASAAIRTNVKVAPILSLSVGNPATDTATVKVTPTENGAFNSKTLPVTVSTNNETGYSLYLSIADGKTDNKLKPSADTNSSVINPVTGTPTPTSASFAANTWGYNISTSEPDDTNTTYSAVPIDRTTPQQTTTAPTSGAGDSYNLTFGTKVDTNLPADTYSTQVVLSAVTNPAYIPPFEGIETMQEMTSTICSNADEGETARLKDARDDKLYWVTKLADGNCWMTQNLDYDISADGITGEEAEQTDLLAGTVWDSSSDYAPQATTTGSPFNNATNTDTYSFDPGLYVNDPSKGWSTCNTYYEDTSACTDGNWTKITDSMSPMTTERTNGTVVDGNTYDAHYLVGNYYQFNAATAGTGASVTTRYDDASSSICPKGWRLPSCGNSNDTNDFYALTTGNSVTTGSTLSKAPYYFIPAGYVRSGSLDLAGNYGYYWSSTAFSSNVAYYLGSYSSRVYPSNNANRYSGYSVRCLAR